MRSIEPLLPHATRSHDGITTLLQPGATTPSGESLHQIAHRLATRYSSIRHVLAWTGGIRPPVRRRAARVL